MANQYADVRLADNDCRHRCRVCSGTDRWCRECLPVRPGSRSCSRPFEESGAAERRAMEMDWVLSDAEARLPRSRRRRGRLRARLAAVISLISAAAWISSTVCAGRRARDLSDAIDQLTLMADVRLSPLVALMNTLSVQGEPARPGGSHRRFARSNRPGAAHSTVITRLPPSINGPARADPLDAPSGPYWRCWRPIATAGHPPAVLARQTFLRPASPGASAPAASHRHPIRRR